MSVRRVSTYTQTSDSASVLKHRDHLDHIRPDFKAPSVDGFQYSAIICNQTTHMTTVQLYSQYLQEHLHKITAHVINIIKFNPIKPHLATFCAT